MSDKSEHTRKLLEEASEKAKKKELSKENFKAFAQEVIKKYQDKGMILDALIWGRIVGLYEAELEEAWAKVAHLEGND